MLTVFLIKDNKIYECLVEELIFIVLKKRQPIYEDELKKEVFENILNEDIYTIGDGYSDVEMVSKYNGYTLNHGIDLLKKKCIKIVSNIAEMIRDILEWYYE